MTAPYGSPAAPPMPAPAPKKPRRWPWILGMIGTLIIGIIIGSSGSTPTPGPAAAAPSSTAAAPAAKPAASIPTAPAAPAPAGPATSFGDGTFKVGTDIAAGSYRSSGPRAGSPVPNCYWARSKDDSGSLDAVIANNNSEGPTRITVKTGEYLQVSGCDFTKA